VLIGDEFNFTEPELEGWYESCKAQAWINEQMAKHMDDGAEKAIRIAIARYFWRRADRIRRLTKKAIEEVESEESK
jgi:hypothetical protein